MSDERPDQVHDVCLLCDAVLDLGVRWQDCPECAAAHLDVVQASPDDMA